MTIYKEINGHVIELFIEKIGEYTKENSNVEYGIYQVYKVVNGNKVPLYKECFTDFDIHKIENDGCRINGDDEVFDDCEDIEIGEEEDEELISLLSV